MIATQNSLHSDDDDTFPEIDGLFSGIRQEKMLVSDDEDDGGGFIDINELLSGMQQKSVPTSADLTSAAILEMVENGTRGGSPMDSSPSSTGSCGEPIILSNDKSAGAESETNYSDLGVNANVRAKSDSDSLHVADSQLANVLGLGATLTSDRLATDHQDGDNAHDGVMDTPQRCPLADRPRPAALDTGSDTYQASELQVNTNFMKESMSFNHLDVTKELETEVFDLFAEGDDVDSRSAKGRTLSAVSGKSLASGSNISGLQDGPRDDTQSPQLVLAAASPHQSDLKGDHVLKRLRRGATRNNCRKRPRMMVPTRLASTTSTTSAAPESANLEEAQCHTKITAPDEKWDFRDTDQETIDDENTDDSDDMDYADISDASGFDRGGRLHSRKRVRRRKDREHIDVEGSPTPPLHVSCQAFSVASHSRTQESEEMSIRGYLTLKTVASKVVYCLKFSQELLPHPEYQGKRQDYTPDLETPQSDSGIYQAPLRVRQRAVHGHQRRIRCCVK